jgi:UDP-N-acetylglucosamine diphosphorylase / glucose-1-phosphate thymidylyltransferase / UDP-N-acetylgalactosamine diphosphorylase / glucosamine-1-phosphate N-acetyltransferase / galactosamine-1-phosphate N-acetyltransferase
MNHPEPDFHPCAPLTLTRALADFPIGNRRLAEHQAEWAASGELGHVHLCAWISPVDRAAFIAAPAATLIAPDGAILAWRGKGPDPAEGVLAAQSFLIRHPWDLLRANECYLSGIASRPLEGEVHASAVIEGVVHLGKGSRILPGVFIEGNVVIGENTKIGPNCYLRGHTSIGDSCHIGQSVEIKNCLILSRTNVGHLSYVGDSVLGEKVNFGAGTIVSNLRHDGKNHRSMVCGELIDTGRRKFGTIIGDGVHTGINTAIYPGRKLWPGASTRPGEVVQHDILS